MDPSNLAFSPAADRNKAPILQRLEQLLPAQASVLEIASGTGQHAEHFAARHPAWTWQPTEADSSAFVAIAARTSALANVRPPLLLDVRERWPTLAGSVDALFCANVLHIAEWTVCGALMRGAAQCLIPRGVLVLYGPFMVEGEPLAPSNAAFDADLRSRNPAWGLRQLSQMTKEAEAAGLAFEQCWDLPANNLILAFRNSAVL